jgi:signal transduction histidine kinase
MQIQTRLTLQFIFIVAGIMFVAMFYIYYQFKIILQNELYTTLKSKATMTAEMTVNYSPAYQQITEFKNEPLYDTQYPYTENVAIYNMDFKRIYTFTPNAKELNPAILQKIIIDKEYRFTRDKYYALGLYYTNKSGISFILVSEAVFNSDYLMILVKILSWVFVAFIAFVALGGWFFAGQALAPIRRIMNEMDAILPANLNQRLEINDQKDEISRLVVTFNKLLDRIQKAFDTQKMFLSNISHELKNPLSLIISQIEIALDKPRASVDYQNTLLSVLDDARGLNQVTDKLMQLAKINSDNKVIDLQKVRIDELLWQSKAFLLKSHPTYKIHFEILNLPEEEEALFINGNEQLLKTALCNLMDNACKYSPDKTASVFLSFIEKEGICIQIKDKGIGIPENELSLIFEPFYRSSKTGTFKGSGIGLSLVQNIMKLHDVQIMVANNKTIGTTVTLVFPLISK